MKIRAHLFVLCSLLLVSLQQAEASCGSTSCSINTNWDEHSTPQPGFSMDLRHSYSRADQLRSGSNKVAADTTFAGEVENLRTINKLTTLSLDYSHDEHWGLLLNVPYVVRDHNHNLGPYDAAGNPAGYESFNAQSLGDLRAVARYRWEMDGAANSGAGIKLGFKLNTGRRDFTLDTGALPNEVTLQPGNGSTDLILGAFWNQATPGDAVSWFAQGALQNSIRALDAFRPGNQANLDLGMRYAVNRAWSLLLQLNGQWNAPDTGSAAALTPAGDISSGGRSYSLTPGITYAVVPGTNLYGLVQLPLYQYVNGEQLTAGRSLTIGVNHRF